MFNGAEWWAKCEWLRLGKGSGWHLIRYFFEKKQIIILPRWVYAFSSSPLNWSGIVHWLLIACYENCSKEFIQENWIELRG